MRMSYGRLFAAPGAVAFTLAGLVARLPMGMFGIGLVLLVSESTGSFAVAGAVSAAGLVGVALSAPVIGRMVDRYGQARVAVPASALSVLACTGTVVCAVLHAPYWTLFVTYALSGCVPFVGTMARARWVRIYEKQPEMLQVANAFERTLDETVFIAGPALGAALCTALGPPAGLIVANVMLMVGTLVFAAQRRTEPEPLPGSEGQALGHLIRGGGTASLLLFPVLGVATGAMEVGTIAYVTSLGFTLTSGLFLGLVALGSSLSGLVFGTLSLRSSLPRRMFFLAALQFVLLLPLPLLLGGNALWFGIWAFVVGAAVAPTLITSMSLLQQVLPEGNINEGMAVANAGLIIGIAGGAVVGGALISRAEAASAFLAVTGSAAVALLVSAIGARRWERLSRTAPHAEDQTAGPNLG